MKNSAGQNTTVRAAHYAHDLLWDTIMSKKFLFYKLSLSKLSNALSKSMKLTNSAEFLSIDCSIFILWSVAICPIHDLPFQNPA